MASNAFQARPESQLHVVAYNTSKAAANSYTIALARELKGKAVVNTATPGFTTTKLNFFSEGGRTPKEAAEGLAVWALETDKDKTGMLTRLHFQKEPALNVLATRPVYWI